VPLLFDPHPAQSNQPTIVCKSDRAKNFKPGEPNITAENCLSQDSVITSHLISTMIGSFGGLRATAALT
jgi:hypothetical protein